MPGSEQPSVDVAEEVFLVADHAVVAAVVGDPERWLTWWPELRCEVYRDRGLKGRQWRVTGALHGTAEVWLEPVRDGVVLHWFLRAEPAAPMSLRRLARERDRWVARWTSAVAALKDELERGRAVGEPRLTAGPGLLKAGARPADDDERGRR